MALVWLVEKFRSVEAARLRRKLSQMSFAKLVRLVRGLIGPIEGVVRNGRMRDANSVGHVLQGAASPQRWFHFMENVARFR
jgi:hypothetical protein